jgi:hypothetical protein
MGYGLPHGSQSDVQTLEENFFQWIVMWLIFSSDSNVICCGSDYRICGR